MKAGTNSKRTAQKRSARRGRAAIPADTFAADADTVVVPFPAAAGPMQPAVLSEGVTLTAECTARCADGLKAALLERLETPVAVGIDIAAVERVDTVCLQLLVAFVRERQRAGRAVMWQGSSEPFAQAIGVLGLGGVLNVPAAG